EAGFGDDDRLPWLETVEEDYREGPSFGRLLLLVVLLLAVLAPLNLLLRKRPEDIGLQPDGDGAAGPAVAAAHSNIVDPAWAAVDWTLGRALRTARFWWLALGYFCGLYVWYAVQVH
ncbi:hypothetical protein, partial [Proteus mirabilis]|uniref:hypothetical protein n=1 Tax=Proteus mirabilis TaxID=584 RepID=UPI003F6878FB